MLKKLVAKLTNHTKMVIVVRTDLNMGKGKIASQAAHAAVSLYESAIKSNNPYVKSWFRFGQPKVVLKTDSSDEIKSLFDQANAQSFNTCIIRDAGRTQIEHGTITALGIGPVGAEDVDKLTKHLKLL